MRPLLPIISLVQADRVANGERAHERLARDAKLQAGALRIGNFKALITRVGPRRLARPLGQMLPPRLGRRGRFCGHLWTSETSLADFPANVH